MRTGLVKNKAARMIAVLLMVCTAFAMSIPASVLVSSDDMSAYAASASKENKNAQMGQSIKKLKTGDKNNSETSDIILSSGGDGDGETGKTLIDGYQKGYLRGIDISCWQGNISDASWKKIAEEIDFVIIRCGYGANTKSRDDTTFEANVAACEKYGIPYGVYLYSYADSVAKAKDEADHCIRLLQGRIPQYPVYYDLEDDQVAAAGSAVIQQMAKAFCQRITDNGYRAGVYASLDWWQNKIGNSVEEYSRWVAQWSKNCSLECDIWQCASNGQLSGISGRLDINELMVPYAEIEEYMEGANTVFTGKAKDVDNYYAFVTAASVKIKSGPGVGFQTNGTLKKGDKVCVSETYNGYAHLINEELSSIEQLQGGIIDGDSEKTAEDQLNESWIPLSTLAAEDSPRGWVDTKEGKKLVKYNGEFATGIVKFKGYYYGFDKNGVMYADKIATIDGEKYYFIKSGQAVIHTATVTKKTKLRTGPGKKYKKKGKIKKGCDVNVIRTKGKWSQLDNGKWFFSSDGKIKVVYLK